jgi:predicted TIM-barrel fold metal-dependent hydrolase
MPDNIPRGTIVDAHCHMFNLSDVALDEFLVQKMHRLPKVIHRAIRRVVRGVVSKSPGYSAESALLDRLERAGELPDEAAVPPQEQLERQTRDQLHQSLLESQALQPLVANESRSWATEELLATYDSVQNAELQQWGEEYGDPEGLTRDKGVGTYLLALILPAAVRIVRAIYWTSQARVHIARRMARMYCQTDTFAPAMMDLDFWGDASAQAPTQPWQQIELMARIARMAEADLIPDSRAFAIRPYAPFNPMRIGQGSQPDAPRPAKRVGRFKVPDVRPTDSSLVLVKNAIEHGGFAGVKIYPPLGYKPLGNAPRRTADGAEVDIDAELMKLYRWAAQKGVPILTHCTPTNAYPGAKGYPAPKNWAPVYRTAGLERLKVILGHFGHMVESGGNASEPAADAWAVQAVDLMSTFPNSPIHVDISNSKLPKSANYRKDYIVYLKALTKKFAGLEDRVLYGTDYPLCLIAGAHKKFPTAFAAAFTEVWNEGAARKAMGANAVRLFKMS